MSSYCICCLYPHGLHGLLDLEIKLSIYKAKIRTLYARMVSSKTQTSLCKGAVSPEHSMFACHFLSCVSLFQHFEKYGFPRNLIFYNKGRFYSAITVVRHMLTEGLKMNELLHGRTLSYLLIGLIPMLLGSI